jgi:sortase (surface protein transpeptidase)
MRSSPAPETHQASRRRSRSGEPIGTLRSFGVGLSGVVVEGDDDSVLDRAIGHLPDHPAPWHTGNSALAAHRDALFRPLRDVRFGDVLRLTTPFGAYEYRVRETLIVKPEDRVGARRDSWLDAHADQLLSLRLHRPCP